MRALLWCITIVAAFQPRLPAAEPPIAHVPATPQVVALGERLGMKIESDRGRFVAEIIRRLYSLPADRQPPLNFSPAAPASAAAASPSVDVPLSASTWSDAILHRRVAPEQLVSTILADRRAALLCRGLAAADDETLAYYASHPALLAFLYEHAAPAFAAFGDSVHVRDGRLVIPGGSGAQALWEGLAHAPSSDPDAFLRALFVEPEARLAYLFDVLATAEPRARAFALGLWIDNDAVRASRFQALGTAVRSSYREWHVAELPFVRPLNDLAILLLRVRVRDTGEPLPPARRSFWTTALDAGSTSGIPEPASASLPLVDAAWLLQAISGDMYARGEKLDQFAFGQRVFAALDPDRESQATAVIREMSTRRMLLLGLERIGITDPQVYEAGIRQSRAALGGGGERFWTVVQQQGALAMLIRMTVNGTLGAADTNALVRSLFAVPVTDQGFGGRLAEWMETVFGPRLPPAATWQGRVVAGLAGGPTPGRPVIQWEGQTYHLDLAFAERRRIEDVRRKQAGPDLDTGLSLARLGRRIAASTSVEPLKSSITEARQLLADAGPQLARPPSGSMAPGVPLPRDGREWLGHAIDDLDRAARGGDLRRATHAGESIIALGDVVLGEALVSLVYASDLGDPEGPALLGANVAFRHDFGFGRRDGEGRARTPWAQPRQDFQPGVPWHVVGSLVGLDIALAPLALHRLRMDGLDTPPRLPSIEREAFAANVTLLNPRALRDVDRDRIVEAIRRGRARVRAMPRNPAELDRIADEIALDGWRRRALRWGLENAADSIENQFSLGELVLLGGAVSGLDNWGVNGLLSFGCVCTRFPGPRTWRVLSWRPQMPMMAASVVDMNLFLAERLAEARLPAALAPSVLATAMQDFLDRSAPADPADLHALVEYERSVSSDTVDDYVAATATLVGPLVGNDVMDPSEP
jgi:hypothetical protein